MIEATYVDHMGDDLSVVNAARVSFGKKSEVLGTSGVEGEPMTPILNDPDKRLIKYLAKHRHMSPFGHCFASFHIKAPIFVARQLVKHKFLRWNEISRRYVDTEPEFYYVDKWRGRSGDKKQGSSGTVDVKGLTNLGSANWASVNTYHSLLQLGVCPEQARMVLPQNTMTEWYWSGSLDAFSDMCLLRCASDTQVETQYVAAKISLKMHELFPVSWTALAKGRQ